MEGRHISLKQNRIESLRFPYLPLLNNFLLVIIVYASYKVFAIPLKNN